MEPRTLLLLALGGVGLYYVTRKKAPRRTRGEGDDDSAPTPKPPPHPADTQQPAWCDVAEVFEEKADAFKESFERAWDEFGYTPGGWENMNDAREKSHELALYVMEDVCPQIPRPTQRHHVDGYLAKYGEPWRVAYDTPFSWAWGRLVQMPV